jgi:hypothetical protein
MKKQSRTHSRCRRYVLNARTGISFPDKQVERRLEDLTASLVFLLFASRFLDLATY